MYFPIQWDKKEENAKENCGNCWYSEESFNLLHCRNHNKKVGATEKCNDYAYQPSKDVTNEPFDGQLDFYED